MNPADPWFDHTPERAWTPDATPTVDYLDPEPPRVLSGPTGEVLARDHAPPVGFARGNR